MSGVGLVEALYRDLDAPADVWLGGIRDAGQKTLVDHSAGVVSEFLLTPAHSLETLSFLGENGEAHRDVHRNAPPELIRTVYLGGPVVSLRERIGATSPELLDAALRGVPDWIGCIGLDPSGYGASLSWAPSTVRPMRGDTRLLLGRVAAHTAAAVRLRRAKPADAAMIDRGRVVHAEGDARLSLESLAQAAQRIDRARTRAAADDERLAMWNALVEGRWSLVERFDSDGRRFFVAKKNDPGRRQNALLDDTARKVVALAAVGRPLKIIAYELGLSEPAVSTALRRAMRALGVRHRSALVELHGALVPEREPAR